MGVARGLGRKAERRGDGLKGRFDRCESSGGRVGIFGGVWMGI